MLCRFLAAELWSMANMAKEVNSEKLVYTVREAAALLGMSGNGVYEACWSGDLPSIKIRGKRLIPRALLHAMIDGVEICRDLP
jgi:excisionase family DNA binding protein